VRLRTTTRRTTTHRRTCRRGVVRRRTALAATLVGLALGAASLPAHADTAPAAPTPGVVAPYATNDYGEPLYRVAAGQQLPAVAPVAHPFKAIVTIETPAGDREFRVFVPTGLSGAPAPTLIAMPGWAQRVEPETYMRWEKIATSHHFVVLYPRGQDLSFNAGRCCGVASMRAIDDDAFLLRMLAVEKDLYPQNTARLYLTGFSNGGMMAYRFACQHPEMVAAIGVVAAAYMSRPFCMPHVAVPVMHIHGRLDGMLPWRGTAFSRLLLTSVPTVPQTDAVFGHVNYWAGVRVRNVYLRGVGHVWPHAGGAGNYDATGQLTLFLLAFHR
jgi:poly(3-hydroxybutyrate) depolymerase